MKHKERRAQWRRVVDEHAKSGLTHVAFCKARGLRLGCFRRWRRRLAGAAERLHGPAVVEVVVAEVAANVVLPVHAVQLSVGGDLSFCFAAGTAPSYLADLVLALRERGGC